MSKIPYFPFYPDDYLSSPKVLKMSDAQQGIYVRLLCLSWKYPNCKLPSDQESLMRLCPRSRWKNIKYVVQECFMIDGDLTYNLRLMHEHSKALAKSEKMKKSANYRWNKEKQDADAMQRQCKGNNNQNQNQNHIKNKDIGTKTEKRFVPPLVDEVTKYCIERGNKIDPQKFLDHYQSNGWKVGKAPMKDWKAAIRTWERNSFEAPERKILPNGREH